VYFFSLDGGRRLAVAAARALLNLPYYAAVMSVDRADCAVHYQSARRSGGAEFNAIYEPAGTLFAASVGSIEYFLTERYCLYHYDRRGRPYRLEIHHRPWSLQVAHAAITMNTMAAANHLTFKAAPRCCTSHAVKAWSHERRRVYQMAIIGACGTSPSNATRRRAGDVMFIRSPRLVGHEVRRTPREHNLVAGRSTIRTPALVMMENDTVGTSFGTSSATRCLRQYRTAARRDANRWASRADTR